MSGRYFCVRDNSLRAFQGLPAGALVSYEDSTGFLWLNDTTSHPARWKAGHLYPLPQMKTPSYLRVLEQPDGTILVGSHRTSLYAFRRRLIHSLPTPGILEFGPILFQQHNGKVWVGGSDLQQLELTNAGPAFESLRIKPGSWNHISALSEDAQGILLIASHNHLGDQVLRDGKFHPFLGRAFDNSAIYAMLLSSSGDQWIGTDTGLYLDRKNAAGHTKLLWSGSVNCLFEADPHTIWVGTEEGLLCFVDERQQPIDSATPWSASKVLAISKDAKGRLWMSTESHGIVRLAGGNFRTFDTAAGLPSIDIYSVAFDDNADLSLRLDVGLIRVRERSVERKDQDSSTRLQIMLLDQSDGLPASVMQREGMRGSCVWRMEATGSLPREGLPAFVLQTSVISRAHSTWYLKNPTLINRSASPELQLPSRPTRRISNCTIRL